jgi:hypothetical protein
MQMVASPCTVPADGQVTLGRMQNMHIHTKLCIAAQHTIPKVLPNYGSTKQQIAPAAAPPLLLLAVHHYAHAVTWSQCSGSSSTLGLL